jgi:hypothetical protein
LVFPISLPSHILWVPSPVVGEPESLASGECPPLPPKDRSLKSTGTAVRPEKCQHSRRGSKGTSRSTLAKSMGPYTDTRPGLPTLSHPLVPPGLWSLIRAKGRSFHQLLPRLPSCRCRRDAIYIDLPPHPRDIKFGIVVRRVKIDVNISVQPLQRRQCP